MSDDLDRAMSTRSLARADGGVRTAADRMSRLPAHVDVNDVVSANYLASPRRSPTGKRVPEIRSGPCHEARECHSRRSSNLELAVSR
jgi:hypothetical protein